MFIGRKRKLEQQEENGMKKCCVFYLIDEIDWYIKLFLETSTIFPTIKDAEKAIQELELQTNTKFSVHAKNIGFGKKGISQILFLKIKTLFLNWQ